MGLLTQIITAIGIISLLVFIALFGHVPRLRSTPVGWTHRFLLHTIPGWIYKLDSIVTGGCFLSSMTRCGSYLVNDKHPLIMIFYLTLVTGGLGLFIYGAWDSLSIIERLFVVLVSTGPYVTLYYAAASDPGIITRDNHYFAMRVYPYDHINFHPGVICRTCILYKPARSKHCSICKACISKHDHHCIWINNCVGHSNTRHFLAFLAATNIFLAYGGYLTFVLMDQFIQKLLPKGAKISDLPWSLYLKGWGVGIIHETCIGTVFLLCALCGILSFCFTFYHVYLIWAGTTTNETFKWSDWEDDIRTGEVHIADISNATVSLSSVASHRPTCTSESDDKSSHGNFRHGDEPNINGYHPQVEPDVPWPKKRRHLLARIPHDPRDRDDDFELPTGVEWRNVKSLKEVDNLYDLSFKENFMRIIWPKKI